MAYVPPFEMPRSEIKDELGRIRHPFRIAIDRAKNPFNIGAIIRTAHSFMAKEIILIGTEPWYERAAMGMQHYENIVELPDERAFLDAAEKEGWRLVAFEKDHAQPQASWRPQTRSWASRCSASITATRSASRPGSAWQNGPEGITKKAVVCSLAYSRSDARLRPLRWV
jgi:hypothetical protein